MMCVSGVFGTGCTNDVEQWQLRCGTDQEVMSKRRVAEVLEWETASGRFEGRKPAVQPRDRRPEQHQKQDKQQCVTPACHSSR
jgi:hypothetical protein